MSRVVGVTCGPWPAWLLAYVISKLAEPHLIAPGGQLPRPAWSYGEVARSVSRSIHGRQAGIQIDRRAIGRIVASKRPDVCAAVHRVGRATGRTDEEVLAAIRRARRVGNYADPKTCTTSKNLGSARAK